MAEIHEFLKDIDDDYLVGLTNKGIVKRSYKDLESENVELTEEGESIKGKIGEIDTVLHLPLTDSTCTCPSSSLCKHVIMTILAAKKMGASATEQNAPEPDAVGVDAGADTEQSDVVGPAAVGQDTEQPNAEADNAVADNAATDEADAGTRAPSVDTIDKLLAIPFEDLKKAARTKEWNAAVELAQNERPLSVEEGNLVTIKGENVALKLAYPLKLSTCSICHDEKICRHKVWALLSLQMDRGVISEGLLSEEQEEEEDGWDSALIGEVLPDLKAYLNEILLVGCARLSGETPYGLERFAIRCHSAGLATLEGKLRMLSEQVKGYQERKIKVTVGGFLSRLTECYLLVVKTQEALLNGENIQPLIGTFKTTYSDIPDLHLCGVGMREFQSDMGFGGKILYFLNEGDGSFYTYTVARPTIYDKGPRNYNFNRAELAPWGLACTLSQLSRSRIILQNGKANDEGRLSATSKARAELFEMVHHLKDEAYTYVYDDFEELWNSFLVRVRYWRKKQPCYQLGMEPPETERLFLIRPKSISDMRYDEATQRLIFYLEDRDGRRLRAQLTYSKQEKTAILGMEKLVYRIKEYQEQVPVFLGSLYMEEGECVLYPIETL